MYAKKTWVCGIKIICAYSLLIVFLYMFSLNFGN